MSERGAMKIAGETATLTFVRTLRHTREHVWDAIATPAGLSDWLMAEDVHIDARTGGTIEMISGPARYRSKGKILRWDPPRCFEYEWNVAPVPEMPHGEHAIFRYELESRGDSTILTVTYERITRKTAPGFLPGLHAFLDRLEAQIDRAPLPDFLARFAETRALYPEWQKK